MGYAYVKETLNTVVANFIYTAYYIHICAKCHFSSRFLRQTAEIAQSLQKLFLTGIEASGLTVILPAMEQRGRGERS